MIYTFYSFKGGVGRSMALANTAHLLAHGGLRVLMLDFDLEAPGLEEFFPISRDRVRRRRGLIDLLLSYKQAMSSSEYAFQDEEFRKVGEVFIQSIYGTLPSGGKLDLLHAGQRGDAQQLSRYALELRMFDWQDFYLNWEGEAFFEWLRRTLLPTLYDVVLIDSRTGVSEMGGICAYQLADVIVMFCAAHRQSLDGTRNLVADFFSSRVKERRKDRDLKVIVVPSRIEQQDSALLSRFRDDFERAFAKYTPESLMRKGISFWHLLIPYAPSLAFDEQIASLPMKASGASDMTAAFKELVVAITYLAGSETPLGRLADRAENSSVGSIPQYDPARSFSRYDAFLSFHPAERKVVEEIAGRLRSRGILIFLGTSQEIPSASWVEILEEVLSMSRVLIIFIGSSGIGNWQQREVDMALKLQQESDFRVVPVLLPGASAEPTFLSLFSGFDLRSGIDEAALAEVESAIREPSRPEQFNALLEEGAPYLGLRPFREADASLFFGRGNEVGKIIDVLRMSSVAVLGASGTGKTSLIEAGVMPQLRREAFPGSSLWSYCSLRPGAQPLNALAVALGRLMLTSNESTQESDTAIHDVSAKLRVDMWAFRDLIELMAATRNTPSAWRLLLFVDQVEELFTLCRDEGERGIFLEQLSHAKQETFSLTLVLAIRSDFYVRFSELYSSLALFPLEPMDSVGIRQAIENPARRAGLAFEPGLVDRILTDASQEPSVLPLLQFLLLALWGRRKEGRLTHQGYEEIGALRGALAAHAEATYISLTRDQGTEARRIILSLISIGEGTGDTRRRETLENLLSAVYARNITLETIDSLAKARLLFVERNRNSEVVTVELAHEALILHWPRARNWLDEERTFLLWRERLRLARQAWENKGQEVGFLLTRAPLAEAEEWIEMRRQDLTKAEEGFIARSLDRHYEELRKEAERQRQEIEREAAWEKQELARRERSRRRWNFGLSALALVLSGFALFWFRHSRLSLSRELAAQAAALREGPLDLALLLSLQAEKTVDTVEARDSLLTLLEGSPALKAFLPGHRSRVSRVVFSPDGRTVASGGADDIFLWNGETGGRLEPPLRGHRGAILGLAFSPGGNILASSGEDRTIRLWRVADHLPLGPPIVLPQAVRNLVVSPDGSLAAGIRGTTIYLWDFPSLQSRGEIPQAHAQFISDLAFDRNGRLASASADGTIVLWDLAQRSKIRTFDVYGQQVLGLAFHPSRDILASAGADQKVRLWNAATGEELGAPQDGHRDAVVSVAFSRDGSMLASAGRDKTVLVWNVASGRWDLTNSRPAATLIGHGKTVWALAFGGQGHLVSGGDDDAAILWHLQAEPRFAHPIAGLAGEADSLAFDAEGSLLAIGGKEGVIQLWDTVARQPRGPSLQEHHGSVNGLAFRGRTLFSGGADGRILVWDLDHPEARPHDLVSPDGAPPSGIWSLALSPDQKILAAGDDRGRVLLWSLDPEKFLGEASKRHAGLVYGLAFNSAGGLLASGAQDGLIRLWDVQQRKLVLELKGHEEPISGLAFSPDGKTLASASVDRTVRLWNPKTGKQQVGSPLTGLADSLSGVAFDPEGKILAASGLEGRVFLWDLESRHSIGIGLRGAGEALNLAFHPNGKLLASGSDQSVLLFDLHEEIWRSEGCRTVGRNLSQDEWRKFLGREPYRQACPEATRFSNLSSVVHHTDGFFSLTGGAKFRRGEDMLPSICSTTLAAPDEFETPSRL